jgi:CubicO group peptidase (beta-lactamase class C family)
MKRRYSLPSSTAILIILASSWPLASHAQVDSLIAAARESNHRLMKEIMLRTDVPGISAAVGVEGEVVWAGAYGFADLEHRVPVREETLFRIGSVSKPLTAAAVALLVQDGVLDLDVPVQNYLPDYPARRWPITTREVAGHIAGIRHYRDEEFLSADRYDTVTEGLEIFKNDTLLFEPGQRFSYSSYGWNLVSAVVEAAAGEPFLDVMQERVLDRLHLDHTAADWTDRIIPNRTSFYERRRDGRVYNAPFVDNSYKWAGGGFLSTPSDLVRFAMAHSDSSFLGDYVVEELWTPLVLDDGDTTNYAIGWGIGRDSEGRRIVSHGGGSIGGTTFLLYYPDRDVAVAIVSNARGPTTPEAAEALAAPYLDPTILQSGLGTDVAGEYACQVANAEEQEDNLTIHLLGSPDEYWGVVDFRDSLFDILRVSVKGDLLRISGIQDGGWVGHLRLRLGEDPMEGWLGGRSVSCTKN